MSPTFRPAPGGPGITSHWTSSAKCGIGTASSLTSEVWFTLSHGIFNEIFYPRVDLACIRDMGLIVTDGRGFFSEEKRDCRHEVSYVSDGALAYRLVNTCLFERYKIEKTIFTNPRHHAVLQETCFTPLGAPTDDYRLYVLANPHLGNRGRDNTAWAGDYKGIPMLFAAKGNYALALACSTPWAKMSVGYVGTSDGWTEIKRENYLISNYNRAENGNVCLTGEVDLAACGGRFVLALGLGRNPHEAGQRARISLIESTEYLRGEYVGQWLDWRKTLLNVPVPELGGRDLFCLSAAVIHAHEAKSFPGAIIASLSIPWGFARGDNDLGGYHLIWPRDLVEAASGLLAAGEGYQLVRRVLHYLQSTQEADGHWPQNMWVDGDTYWQGVQMDEAALPILLAGQICRERKAEPDDSTRLWSTVRRAAANLVKNGPTTGQDRWEENGGYTPFTLAAEIAALLVAADMADVNGEHAVATHFRETADAWNASIERWLYVTGTELARRVGVEGYYVRIVEAECAGSPSPDKGNVTIKNRPPDDSIRAAAEVVSVDALALVRFGLRAADDPRIVNTVKVIDAILKVETPFGPCWRRYNNDGYGEKEDGSPFDGTGIGRAWPLLTGERAHYELAAGRRDEAVRLLRAMAAFANEGGMIPEQVWDAPDIPARELYFGRPAGSAMPLVWAHAEYLKLRRSLRDGRVFDTPRETAQRYLVEKAVSPYAVWRAGRTCGTIAPGKTLRLEVLAPARVRWSIDGWQASRDTDFRDTGLGVFVADLPTETLWAGTRIDFTFEWTEAGHWEGHNFAVTIG